HTRDLHSFPTRRSSDLSVLFFVCSLYVPTYLKVRKNRPNRLFCSALLVLLAMMTLITESQHLGLMWVALEANTLASAPLLLFHRSEEHTSELQSRSDLV